MSVETITGTPVEQIDTIKTMTPEQVRDEVNGILHATTEQEAREHEMGFEEISKLFLDAHINRMDDIEQIKRDIVLETLLDNPLEAFRGEFLQLKMLFDNRTLRYKSFDGVVTDEFCTQDHVNNKLDYLFRHIELPSGAEKFEVSKVHTNTGQPVMIRMELFNGQMKVFRKEWHRGQFVDVQLEEEEREQVMLKFFFDTIHASAVQIERLPDEREENDTRAIGYLDQVQNNAYIRM